MQLSSMAWHRQAKKPQTQALPPPTTLPCLSSGTSKRDRIGSRACQHLLPHWGGTGNLAPGTARILYLTHPHTREDTAGTCPPPKGHEKREKAGRMPNRDQAARLVPSKTWQLFAHHGSLNSCLLPAYILCMRHLCEGHACSQHALFGGRQHLECPSELRKGCTLFSLKTSFSRRLFLKQEQTGRLYGICMEHGMPHMPLKLSWAACC